MLKHHTNKIYKVSVKINMMQGTMLSYCTNQNGKKCHLFERTLSTQQVGMVLNVSVNGTDTGIFK